MAIQVEPLLTGFDRQMLPAASWNGQHHLMAYVSAPGAFRPAVMHVAPVAGDGKALGVGRPFPDRYVEQVALGWNGQHHLLANISQYHVHVRRLSPAGEMVEASPVAVSAGASSGNLRDLTVVAGGSSFLVAWTSYKMDLSNLIEHCFASVVRGDGTVARPGGIPLGTGPEHQRTPAVASDGTSFLALWEESPASRIMGLRLDRDGNVLGAPVVVAQQGESPALAWAQDAYVVVWRVPAPGTGFAGIMLTPEARPIADRAFTIAGGDTRPSDVRLAFFAGGTGVLTYRRLDSEAQALRLRVRAMTFDNAAPLPGPDAAVRDAPTAATDVGGAAGPVTDGAVPIEDAAGSDRQAGRVDAVPGGAVDASIAGTASNGSCNCAFGAPAERQPGSVRLLAMLVALIASIRAHRKFKQPGCTCQPTGPARGPGAPVWLAAASVWRWRRRGR